MAAIATAFVPKRILLAESSGWPADARIGRGFDPIEHGAAYHVRVIADLVVVQVIRKRFQAIIQLLSGQRINERQGGL